MGSNSKFATYSLSPSVSSTNDSDVETSTPPTVQFTNLYPGFAVATHDIAKVDVSL